MINKLDALWAKKNRDKNNIPQWLPLKTHLNDTRETMGFLWEHYLSQGVKDLIKNSMKTDTYDKESLAKNLCMFLGAVHDIGKASPYFQLKKSFKGDNELDGLILEKLKSAGFNDLDKFFTADNSGISHQSIGQFILLKRGVNITIADIVGAHHGRPVETSEIYDRIHENHFYQNNDSSSEIHKTWLSLHDEIFTWALNSCGFSSVKEIPMLSQNGQVILSALLIMADWITSNESYFPLINVEEDKIDENRIKNGLLKWNNDRTSIWEPLEVNVDTIYEERFKLKSGEKFIPRDAQVKITEAIDKAENPGIVIFEAPMGMGKTEAALVAVEQLARKTGRTGMFFGLPTQATSNGIFSRVNAWLENLRDDMSYKRALRLLHGKAALNEEFANLPKSRNIHDDENEKNVVTVNDWFSGRKLSILDDFTVGTVDQFLLLALKQKHLMLRHLGFANKVVVIDEVHAYDAYMSVYLYQAIKWMGAYGVPVVILSATLPIERRNKLIESYMVGAGYKFRRLPKPDNFDNNEAYPLLTLNDSDKILQYDNFEKASGINYEINKLSKEDSEDIAMLIEGITSQGVVGVIVNTVKKAQDFAKLCTDVFGEENVFLLHSLFIATDRYNKEKELLDLIGRDGKRPKFKIVIGTQVIEQSLDIDFDVLITDLAPIDLLLQRMGREHRHKRYDRPENLKEPKVYVLNSKDYNFDKASTYVYDPYLLFRTEYYLPDKINLPNDISHLVQLVYSEKELALEYNLKDVYNKYSIDFKNKLQEKESKAKSYRLGPPEVNKISDDNNILDWIEYSDKNAEASEIKASAQVRDSDDTIEVIALKKCEGGYKFFDEKGILNPLDNKTAIKMAQHTIRLPRAVYYGFGIAKVIKYLEDYYKENLSGWDNQSWLKDTLGIVFDENNEFRIFDKILHYDTKYGLTVKKEDGDERI